MYASTILATAAIFAGAALADHPVPAPAAYPAAPAAPAAYGTPAAPAYPAGTPAAPAAGDKVVHVVQVGGPNGQLTFNPANTVAKIGDMVQFQFWPKNHSVVQAAFASPCTPLTTTQPNVTDAFFSGFVPSTRASETDPAPVFTIEVTKDSPQWFYCSFMKHCQAGMVGSINSPETPERSVAIFAEKAKGAVDNLSPGQIAPAQPNNSTGSPGTTLVPEVPGAGAATGTGVTPPQASFTGAASGRLLDVAKNSAFGVAAIAAAFFVL